MSGKIKVIQVLGNPKGKKRKKVKARKARKNLRWRQARGPAHPFAIEVCQVKVGPGRRESVTFSYWTGSKLAIKATAAKRYATEAAARKDAAKAIAKAPACHGARIVRL